MLTAFRESNSWGIPVVKVGEQYLIVSVCVPRPVKFVMTIITATFGLSVALTSHVFISPNTHSYLTVTFMFLIYIKTSLITFNSIHLKAFRSVKSAKICLTIFIEIICNVIRKLREKLFKNDVRRSQLFIDTIK